MSITLNKVSLPGESDEYFVHLINSLLTPSECNDLIAQYESELITSLASHSKRLRHMFDSQELAAKLWERLSQFYDGHRVTDSEGYTWVARRINTRFRFCKYRHDDAFAPHVDGCLLLGENEQSFLTVNIYLNTVAEDHGGSTRVLKELDASDGGPKYEMVAKIQPTIGMASIFRDSLLHDGEAVKDTQKYLLRTDVVFEREVKFNFWDLYRNLSDVEKGKKAWDIAQRLEDGGNRDAAILWYKKAMKFDPNLD